MRVATISACVRSNTSRSPSSALCPTPITVTSMAPGSSDDVCGATIESCQDHSETKRSVGSRRWRLSSASHGLPGRSCASDVPNSSQACMLPWCGAPIVMTRASLLLPYFLAYARATNPPMLCATTMTDLAWHSASTASILPAS